MNKLRKTVFISDLHLQVNEPHITEQFLAVLDTLGSEIDALYILGDLFELWIGDDDHSPFHQQIMQALRKTREKNIALYFMYGNRDFLIGKKFLRATGCELLADEEKILLYGKPLLLMHGDLLCIEDVAYLKARKLGKNKLAQTIFLLMPLNYRRRYANRMRAKSKRHTSTAPRAIMDVTQSEVERIMQKHNVTSLIHGHTHRPQTHYFPLQHQTAERIVLGAWHDGANGLVWDERGNKEWVKFNF